MNAKGMFVLAVCVFIAGPLAADENATNVPAANAVSGPVGTTSWTAGMSYAYDASGNVTEIGNDRFVYDDVDRLVSDKVSGIERRHAYDAYGNRTSCLDVSSGGDCQGATIVNGVNRISGATYDAAGNLTAYSGNTYTYDVTGMLIRDTAVAGGREYVYTASGERIAVIQASTGTWTWSLRDSSAKVLREMTSTATANGSHTNWTWTRDNIWRDSQLLSSLQRSGSTTTTFHYHLDHLGTPRLVSNTSGTIVGVHDYAAFGTELSGNLKESPESRLKFTGHERDIGATTEPLDYMHARFYNGRWGRFLSVDPVLGTPARPQSWNRYSYVENNPVSAIDPTGMKMECVTKDDGSEECTFTPDDPNPAPFPQPEPLPDWVINIQAGLTFGRDADDIRLSHADGYWRNLWNPEPMQIQVGFPPIVGGGAQSLLGNSRLNLLQNIKNPKLAKLIKALYRENARIGTGSTADAIRYEAQTGIMLSATGHITKGLQMRTALMRVLRSESLSAVERQAVRAVLIDIQKALSGL